MAKLRTCTTMVFTDGKRSVYAVMQGPMARKAFNAAKATVVATYEIVAAPLVETDYCAMTAAHATKDAPPVPWQMEGR